MNTPADFKTLVLGDIVGLPGLKFVLEQLPKLIALHSPDLVVANGENAADDGLGLLPEQFYALLHAGVDVVTSGNHIWEKKVIYELLKVEKNLLRPENYSKDLPGNGWCLVEKNGWKAFVCNFQGRSRMVSIDDPFVSAKSLVGKLKNISPLIFIDFHAEAPEEKEAFGYFMDGLVTSVVGTHTHVATVDGRVLPGGTAFQGDLGMCGPSETVIGGQPGISIERALTMMPLKSVMGEGQAILRGVLIEADRFTGKAKSIRRIEI